jgi:hypothetical protein
MSDTLYGDGPEVDAMHLLSNRIDNTTGKLLGKLTVKPQGQERMLLGSFTAADKLKGFSIGISPNPDSDGSVVTHIANAGTAEKYKLLLHVINYGTKPITASIWRL